MSREIGVVIIDVPFGELARDAGRRVAESLHHVPQGRCLVAVYETTHDWSVTEPFESVLCRSVLGPPEDRHHAEFEFFANGVSRSYRRNRGQLTLAGNLHWVVFRRLGDRAYRRRESLRQMELRRNELPVGHKVFTRDVANNVWHLNAQTARGTTMNRLCCLLAWRDERALIVKNSGNRSIAINAMDLDRDLVGVAHRIPYDVDRALGLVLF